LALCCSLASSIQEALTCYEQRRIPRTQLMQTRSASGEMRYYATETEASEQQMQESQMSSEDYQNWAFNYKPEIKFE
ncbi:MAG: FAD-binding monooxygenase, partial [Cyanobacteria bacterium J06592_8]